MTNCHSWCLYSLVCLLSRLVPPGFAGPVSSSVDRCQGAFGFSQGNSASQKSTRTHKTPLKSFFLFFSLPFHPTPSKNHNHTHTHTR